jgi:hypothetical protein
MLDPLADCPSIGLFTYSSKCAVPFHRSVKGGGDAAEAVSTGRIKGERNRVDSIANSRGRALSLLFGSAQKSFIISFIDNLPFLICS